MVKNIKDLIKSWIDGITTSDLIKIVGMANKLLDKNMHRIDRMTMVYCCKCDLEFYFFNPVLNDHSIKQCPDCGNDNLSISD